MWPASVDFVIGDDLVLRFLQLHHLAELVGLASLALANDLGRWLEQAEELSSLRVLPRKIRALVCFITCLTRDVISSSSWRRPSNTSCFNAFAALHSLSNLP